jgi:uncharacterized protein YecT (DUF1311 family)
MTFARYAVVAMLAAFALSACDRKTEAARTPAPAAAEAPAASSASVATDGARGQADGAQTHSAAYETCMATGDAAKGVTAAMADCVIAELRIEDARLNAVYKRVIAGLDEAAEENLRQTQRAWIAERDRRCRAEAAGGTIDRINIPACVLDVTIERTKQLEAMAAAAG